MDFTGIIPARYESSRFPGKPLALIGDKPMIQWVYERSSQVLDEVYVATDDKRIFDVVASFGGNVIMTSSDHLSGTDRCLEAMDSIIAGTGVNIDVIINIQGDEPFIEPEMINSLKSCFDDKETEIATLIKMIDNDKDLFDENKPKVIFDINNYAINFSRSTIPFIRLVKKENWRENFNFFRHIGIYAYKSEVLRKITKLDPSDLERAESLEQLRWLENGFKIKVEETSCDSIGIDTPEDLKMVLKNNNSGKLTESHP